MNQHTTVLQNNAHRNDLNWTKTGRTYKNYAGVTITKNCMTYRWEVRNPAGVLVTTAHSLTWAKMDAEAKA